MKPYIHAQSSAKQFGGKPEDYLEIHNWFDSSKAFIGTWIHRALYHHTAGIFLAEKIFGVTITNSDNKKISVRDVGEQHVLEDFGGKFIPTPQDYFQHVKIEDWMGGQGLKEVIQKTGSYPLSLNPDGNEPIGIYFDGSTIYKSKEGLKLDLIPSGFLNVNPLPPSYKNYHIYNLPQIDNNKYVHIQHSD